MIRVKTALQGTCSILLLVCLQRTCRVHCLIQNSCASRTLHFDQCRRYKWKSFKVKVDLYNRPFRNWTEKMRVWNSVLKNSEASIVLVARLETCKQCQTSSDITVN